LDQLVLDFGEGLVVLVVELDEKLSALAKFKRVEFKEISRQMETNIRQLAEMLLFFVVGYVLCTLKKILRR